MISGFARDRRVRSATITAIGAASSATIGAYDMTAGSYQFHTFDEQVELASFIGDIAMSDDGPVLHAHVVLGRQDGTALAGHLKALHVRPTMEVTLTQTPALVRKSVDPHTGLTLIDLSEGLPQPGSQNSDPALPRGVGHIGLTVPDIEEATAFLRDAFGARVAYDGLTRQDPPREGAETERQLGMPQGSRIAAQRMVVIGTGPGLELFEVESRVQRPSLGLVDIGWGHVALFVDDLPAVLDRAVAAGAVALSEPHDNSPHEDTLGNSSVYLRAPWGTLIELQALPNGHWYGPGSQTNVWTPPADGVGGSDRA